MLEYRNISIGYGADRILEDISVSFPKGKITTLIGPNGCGKSTLLQAVIGSAHVEAGNIYIDGVDSKKMSPRERAAKVAFLPQMRGIVPSLPVHTLVEHGRFPYMGFGRKASEKDHEIVQNALTYAKVLEYAEQMTDTLSGGIRQRVYLAMILAQDSEIIILDEPITYLDMKGQREFLKLATGLKERGKTVIIVLHDIQQAMEIADYVVVMNKKKIVFDGKIEKCLDSHIIEKVFDVECFKIQQEDKEYYFYK